MTGFQVTVIIPALNEEATIGMVVAGLMGNGANTVIVVDNGSTDNTVDAAITAGAKIVYEPRRGYGSACLAGIAAAGNADIVVFADGDACDDPDDLPALIEPIRSDNADMVIGSRLTGKRDPGALPIHSRVGNRIASIMLYIIYRQKASDLGPFRAIKMDALGSLQMQNTGFGWTAEMQAKAAMLRLRTAEVPVHYRKRVAGQSKITGNIKASFTAGWIIITTLLLTRIRSRRIAAEYIEKQEKNT